MGIFDGLEKFGFDLDSMGDLFGEEEKKEQEEAEKLKKATMSEEPKEEDFLMDRSVTCTVCDRTFLTRALRTTKLRRAEPDKDLRPRYQYIDALKYEVESCPFCGYTAMSKYFTHLSSHQIKLIKEGVCTKFRPSIMDVPMVYDYDTALERYKLSLFNTMVKMGKTSEKAYTCLKMSWLCRGMIEELMEKGAVEESETIKRARKMETEYYAQAFEGLTKAIVNEPFPICGMDQHTMDMLLAEMAFKLERYDVSAKLVSGLITSGNTPSKIKEKARDLKEEIIAVAKKNK